MSKVAQFQSFFERLSNTVAGLCVLFGVVVLFGWLSGLGFLMNPFPEQVPVAPTTAFAFLAAGSALLRGRTSGRKAKFYMRLVACMVFALGALIIVPYVFKGAVDLEQYLFSFHLADITQEHPGRMSPNTAVGMLLAGAAIFLLSLDKRKFFWAEVFACFLGLCGYFNVVGYLYSFSWLVGFASYTRMALPTGMAFSLLALGIFFYYPGEGMARVLVDAGAAGVLARRLVPAALVVPLGLGAIKIAAMSMGRLQWDSGSAFVVVSETVVMLVLIGITSHAVGVLDRERLRLKEQRDDFIAVLIHDLEDPLIGSERLLENLHFGQLAALSPQQQQVFATLKETNAELLQKIKNLLEYHRLNKGPENIDFKAIDLAAMVKRVGEKFQAQAQSQNKHILVSLPESLPQVLGDEAALEQVLSNLVQNAIKFTNAGGSIELRANALKFLVDIQVRDNGKGMSKEDQEKLLKAFGPGTGGEQLPSGTGLGLYLCDQIVKAHRGHLTCMSELERGSTFVISLPRDTTFEPPSFEAESA